MFTEDFPAPPELRLSLSEVPRAARETAQLMFQLRKLIKNAPRGQGQPILTLPGYGAADGSMAAMRYFLTQIGYKPYGLKGGRNFEAPEDRIMSVDDASRFRNKMNQLVQERLVKIHKVTGKQVGMIGWSMGGCYALDVSQEHPEKVSQVITLGTPYGDPRGTSTWDIMRWLNKSTVPPETMDFASWMDRRNLKAEVPVHVIYSQKDGIVAEEVARLPDHPSVNHHVIDSSHVAFAYNAKVYKHMADLLAAC